MGDLVLGSDVTIETENVEHDSIDTEEMYRFDGFEIETPNFGEAVEEFTISADKLVDELDEKDDEIKFLEEGSFLVIPE
jgi:hypothetical protein